MKTTAASTIVTSARVRLFWLSFILLFGEILAVRWLGIEFPIVRIFPNLIIMVVLVAASAGLIKSDNNAPTIASKNLLLVGIATSILTLLLIFSKQLGLSQLTLRLDSSTQLGAVISSLLILGILIAAVYVVFQRVGWWLGEEFSRLEPLEAYSLNLAGSIAGTLTFALISWLGLAPWVWLAITGAVSFFLYRKTAVAVLSAFAVVAAFVTTNSSIWSPYSKLDVKPLVTIPGSVIGQNNYILFANNAYFHLAVRMLSDREEEQFDRQADRSVQEKPIRYYYQWLKLPFESAPKHDRVLVLGAGSGNDVAFCLSKGAKHVDAVEIDPFIAQLGRSKHPNRPYLDPKVTVYTEDARTFLRRSRQKYDLIEFAYLDPGATLNAASFLRVDNYVYTVEAFKAALNCVDQNGIVSVTFATGADSVVTARLYRTIADAIGTPPLAFTNPNWDSVIFLFGPGAKDVNLSAIMPKELKPYTPGGEMRFIQASTDQRPFLYISYDAAGIWLYFLILIVAVGLPALILVRGSDVGISGSEWANMFFLGQAFMLMETKSITHLSLLIGATWIVSSAVIATILILAWLANYVVSKQLAPRPLILYAGLLTTLLIQYFVQIPESTNVPQALITVGHCVLDCLPILFGSMIFSSCFSKTRYATHSLAANLLGLSIGGLTENLCIVMGINALTLVALVLYGLSFIAFSRMPQNRASG